MSVASVATEQGDREEWELAVVVRAILDGEAGPVAVERRYEALPRQNDTVDRAAVDTDDRLVADAATVHVHTKFYGPDDGAGSGLDDGAGSGLDDGAGSGLDDGAGSGLDGGAGASDDERVDPAAAVEAGEFRRDGHSRWEPTDPSVLIDGASFEAACRGHFEETASTAYERGAEAL